jgi:SAM-dependent methyltransferase
VDSSLIGVAGMTSYYAQRLSAERLARCYELAAPRMQRYLEQEIVHLLTRVRPGERVLELGCGYGRVALRLAAAGAQVVGIDVAEDSLALARRDAVAAGLAERCRYLNMDATALAFDDASFDAVACVQNGIAAFRVEAHRIVAEAWRVLRPGGRLLLATYAEDIWPDRLAWFRTQSEHGLVGLLDEDASRDGVIVCSDGFRSGARERGPVPGACAAARCCAHDRRSRWLQFVVRTVQADGHDCFADNPGAAGSITPRRP